MSPENTSHFEDRLGPLPQQDPEALSRIEDSFRYGASQRQLERIVTIVTSPQIANLEPEARANQHEVLTQGTLHGRTIGMPEAQRNAQDEIDERLFMAKLLIKSPQTAEAIAEAGIAGFHATSSFGLAGIVESGAMYQASVLHAKGKASRGAGDAAVNGKGQTTMSFGSMHAVKRNVETWGGPDVTQTDSEAREQLAKDVDDARHLLAEMEPDTRGEKLMRAALHNASLLEHGYKSDPNSLASTMLRHRFPVVVGVNAEFVRSAEETREKGHLLIGERYFAEFRPNADEIPMEALPVIGVPANYVDDTKKLLAQFGREGVNIVALEDLLEVA
jgi:hypothetical protein